VRENIRKIKRPAMAKDNKTYLGFINLGA